MRTIILGCLLTVAIPLCAQDFNEDNPPPRSEPPADDDRNGLIWEGPYIPQTPTDPPVGPTKLPPLSVRFIAEVTKIEDAGPRLEEGKIDTDTSAGKLDVRLNQAIKLNSREVPSGDSVAVELMEHVKIQNASSSPRTLSDVRVGTTCTLVGYQRRDGTIVIGRIELP